MGRTIPTWRIVVDQKIAELSRFRQFLRGEDRAVFDDLLTQCKLYAAEAGVLAPPANAHSEAGPRNLQQEWRPSSFLPKLWGLQPNGGDPFASSLNGENYTTGINPSRF